MLRIRGDSCLLLGLVLGLGAAGGCAGDGFTVRPSGGAGSAGDDGGRGGSGGSGAGGRGASGGRVSRGGNGNAGGAGARGGQSTSGGANAEGGSPPIGGAGGGDPNGSGGASGGTKAAGGAQSTGGASAKGGTGGAATGGAATGGAATGGAATGGKANGTGGVQATGGAPATGGVTNTTGGAPACDAELLRNADFENGDANWVGESNWPGAEKVIVTADNAVLESEGVVPHSGKALAWLGGIPDSSKSWHITLQQEIELPPGASGLSLEGYIRIHTEEPDFDNTFDAAFIEIIRGTGDDETVLFVTDPWWTPRDASAAWKAFSHTIEANEWTERKLTFRITSRSDDGYKTHFWFDALSLVATCGR